MLPCTSSSGQSLTTFILRKLLYLYSSRNRRRDTQPRHNSVTNTQPSSKSNYCSDCCIVGRDSEGYRKLGRGGRRDTLCRDGEHFDAKLEKFAIQVYDVDQWLDCNMIRRGERTLPIHPYRLSPRWYLHDLLGMNRLSAPFSRGSITAHWHRQYVLDGW